MKPEERKSLTLPSGSDGLENVKSDILKLVETMPFSPNKADFDVLNDAIWKKGEPVPYAALAATFQLIEDESKRLKITEILSNFLRCVVYYSPDDLVMCTYLSLNQICPAFEGIELGVGKSLLLKAICESTGRSSERIKEDMDEFGDVGIVAANSRSEQSTLFKPTELSVRKVFDTLTEIAKMSGNASMTRKVAKTKEILSACANGQEAKYFVRALSGKLRIGISEQTVLMALAQTITKTPPPVNNPRHKAISDTTKVSSLLKSPKKYAERYNKIADLIKTAYCELPSLNQIIPVVLKYPIEELPNHCNIIPGVPLKSMLAQPTTGVHAIFERFEDTPFTCEYKYDGERAQIHLLEDGAVKIYSRTQESNTQKYPDIVSRIPHVIKPDAKVTSFIMDAEAVAWDVAKKEILPFQVLSTRKRKDVNEGEITVKVCIFAFDLIYLNGVSYTKEPLVKRRQLLRDNFVVREGEFQFADSIDSTTTEDIQAFLNQSLKDKCEGLMIKTLEADATYQISKRSKSWLKLKSDYLEGVGDSLDLVVIGATKGEGKRTGVYGNFLLACYCPESEEYQTICKLGTGLSDDFLKETYNLLKSKEIKGPKSYYRCDGSIPDVWFEPTLVWEILASDLSISPKYQAAIGQVHDEKGISLRFPRYIRTRDDKQPEDATTSTQVANMYNNQANKTTLA
jgi:DNA ligase-1